MRLILSFPVSSRGRGDICLPQVRYACHPLVCPYQLLDPHIDWQAQILQILRRIFACGGREDCELTTVRMLLEMWELLAGTWIWKQVLPVSAA